MSLINYTKKIFYISTTTIVITKLDIELKKKKK